MTPDHSLRTQPSRTAAPSSDAMSAPPAPPPPAPAVAAAGGPRTGFVYDGRLGELYGIFLMNLLWTFLTLSIFRFWAKTRMRRYLWSRTSLNGDRFEYTGTGGELFIGFLIVMAVYVVASIAVTALGIMAGPESALSLILQYCLGVTILYLTFVAQYAAQRYRLTRTIWRGISGGMTGSAWAWGFKGMWFSILSLLSLTLAWPWAQMRLIDDRINNSYFGDAKASIQTSSRSLYKSYVIGTLVALLVSGGIAYAAYSYITSNYGDTLAELFSVTEQNPDRAAEYSEAFTVLYVTVIGTYLLIFVVSILAFAAYYAAIAREVARNLALGTLRFATPVTAGAIINRYLWNLVIIVFTLGLGLPIAIHRSMQFLAANIQVIGEIEGSDITHANLPRPKSGEGLLEAFDPGIM
ncbi:MAG: DUF898 family protein [Rhodospirillaceae bacterium]|nr:DUF898 family protein [Rhodospirillaceae bacterium]